MWTLRDYLPRVRSQIKYAQTLRTLLRVPFRVAHKDWHIFLPGWHSGYNFEPFEPDQVVWLEDPFAVATRMDTWSQRQRAAIMLGELEKYEERVADDFPIVIDVNDL